MLLVSLAQISRNESAAFHHGTRSMGLCIIVEGVTSRGKYVRQRRLSDACFDSCVNVAMCNQFRCWKALSTYFHPSFPSVLGLSIAPTEPGSSLSNERKGTIREVVRKFEYSKVYIHPISGHGYSRLRARPQAMTATRTNL
jgi:hypothetical protein